VGQLLTGLESHDLITVLHPHRQCGSGKPQRMHPVQAPQQRYGMHPHVLQPDEGIPHHDRDRQPERDTDIVEQLPSMLICKYRHAHLSRRKDKTQHEAVEVSQPEGISQVWIKSPNDMKTDTGGHRLLPKSHLL